MVGRLLHPRYGVGMAFKRVLRVAGCVRWG